MEARGASTGSELELLGALPLGWRPVRARSACLQVGWVRRDFPLQKSERGALRSHGASHRQP